MAELRDYQKKAIEDAYEILWKSRESKPVISLPTGAGKSMVIAGLSKVALDPENRIIPGTGWPGSKVLILCHRKELIVQDARALKRVWPDADIGIWSAGLGTKDMTHDITIAGIASIYKMENPFNLIIIDECHLVAPDDLTMFRSFLQKGKARAIGLTATPYRLGQGYLNEGDNAFFTDILEPITIRELQERGLLCYLRTKATAMAYSLDGIKIIGGEFSESDLEETLNQREYNRRAAKEIVGSAIYYKRRHVLVFATSIRHAENLADEIREAIMRRRSNITACELTSANTKEQREYLLECFKSGKLNILVTVGILTTGFDAPETNMIAMCRPTLSPALYVQMLGRGMRPKAEGAKDCLVLDFAGNAAIHGPVAEVRGPRPKTKGIGLAPMKTCPECLALIPLQSAHCPDCGHEFPRVPQYGYSLYEWDINGGLPILCEFQGWEWSVHKSRASGKSQVQIRFLLPNGESASKFLCIYPGYPDYIKKKGIEFMKGLYAQIKEHQEEARRTNRDPEIAKKLPIYPTWDGIAHKEGSLTMLDIPKAIAELEIWARPWAFTVSKEGRYWNVDRLLTESEWREIKRLRELERSEQNEAREKLLGRADSQY